MITLPFLPLVAALCAALPHPHYNRATIIPGVNGKVTATYYTVPFNPDQVANRSEGFEFHLGRAQFKTDIPLQCGEVTIPKGVYVFRARRGSDNKSWNAILIPGEPGRRGLAPKQGAKPLVLPSSTFAGKHQEHLTIAALNYGYVTAKRGSVEAKGGVEAEFRISFGDLHTSFSFKEIMKEEKVDK